MSFHRAKVIAGHPVPVGDGPQSVTGSHAMNRVPAGRIGGGGGTRQYQGVPRLDRIARPGVGLPEGCQGDVVAPGDIPEGVSIRHPVGV